MTGHELDLGESVRGPSPVAREVPCRDCGTPTGITQLTLACVRVFQRALAGRGEPLLRDTELVRCDACGAAWRQRVTDAVNRRASELARAIRLLRAGGTPDAERAAEETVRQLHSSPVIALAAISQSRRTGKGGRISAAEIGLQSRSRQMGFKHDS